ncbi:MAG: ATP-binding protein [Planctomycetaceae bacterium]|nr:ATP-binding protein [Planctomycetaceae bacterium]
MVSKNNAQTFFQRSYAATLKERLDERRTFIQVVSGPRQVGKTTLVEHVLGSSKLPSMYVTADEPALRDTAWLNAQWERGRLTALESKSGAVLALDEIQKIPGWSETVKRLWDEDTRSKTPLKVVLLGSAPLLVQRGLTESLAGRFESIHLPHWSFREMRDAFGFTINQFIYFGGYPGAALLVKDTQRWKRYMLDSLIETTISRDVLLMTRVDKPALLRRLFELGCRYSGQILSYTKMLGQLHDAGNTTTLAHYLELLAGAGMLTGLQKYSGGLVRQRGSSPKFQVFNTALMTAQSDVPFKELTHNRDQWGRFVESAVGAHLANAAAAKECEVFYWRDGNHEVDFVIKLGRIVVGIEVKSGRTPRRHSGIEAFSQTFKPKRNLVVGEDGIPLDEFLSKSVASWLQG